MCFIQQYKRLIYSPFQHITAVLALWPNHLGFPAEKLASTWSGAKIDAPLKNRDATARVISVSLQTLSIIKRCERQKNIESAASRIPPSPGSGLCPDRPIWISTRDASQIHLNISLGCAQPFAYKYTRSVHTSSRTYRRSVIVRAVAHFTAARMHKSALYLSTFPSH